MRGDQPTHVVVLTNKQTKITKVVGAGWSEEWGISIVLDPGIVLDWRICDDYYLSVKPKSAKAVGRNNNVE